MEGCDGFLGEWTESDAPALEEDYPNGILRIFIYGYPFFFGDSISVAVERGFVELWDCGGFVLAERGEDRLDEGDLVGAWLAAVLEEGIGRVGSCQGV